MAVHIRRMTRGKILIMLPSLFSHFYGHENRTHPLHTSIPTPFSNVWRMK